jgi:hypothetical protein
MPDWVDRIPPAPPNYTVDIATGVSERVSPTLENEIAECFK